MQKWHPIALLMTHSILPLSKINSSEKDSYTILCTCAFVCPIQKILSLKIATSVDFLFGNRQKTSFQLKKLFPVLIFLICCSLYFPIVIKLEKAFSNEDLSVFPEKTLLILLISVTNNYIM